jgi:hypothetical protein
MATDLNSTYFFFLRMLRLRFVAPSRHLAAVRCFSATRPSLSGSFLLSRPDTTNNGARNYLSATYVTNAVVLEYRTPTYEASVHLPAPYVARFIGVLEGGLETCNVVTKANRVSLTPAGEHKFLLSASSDVRMRNDNSVTAGQTWKWEVEPGEAVLMHRFLVAALHYLNGFGMINDQPTITSGSGGRRPQQQQQQQQQQQAPARTN